jgi:hypothetical protein
MLFLQKKNPTLSLAQGLKHGKKLFAQMGMCLIFTTCLHLRALRAYELEGVTWLLGKVLLRVYLEHYIELHTSWFACDSENTCCFDWSECTQIASLHVISREVQNVAMISGMQGGTQAQTVKGTSKRIVVEVNMDYLLKMYSTDIDASAL